MAGAKWCYHQGCGIAVFYWQVGALLLCSDSDVVGQPRPDLYEQTRTWLTRRPAARHPTAHDRSGMRVMAEFQHEGSAPKRQCESGTTRFKTVS